MQFTEDFARSSNPNKRDNRVLNAAQRSVDLTVRAVMAGSDEAVKADLTVWKVSADPEYQIGAHGVADTVAYAADGVDPKEIDIVFGPRILSILDSREKTKFSHGITARGGDPALLVVGAHELSHGADGNIGIDDENASEADVGVRVREIVKSSPDVSDGID